MKILAVAAALILAGCGYDNFGPYQSGETPASPYNTNIGDLRAYYYGTPLTVDRDMVVRGVVTSSDRGNNFYRTLVVEDATGALEVFTGLYDMHNIYPVGQPVVLRLDGLTIGMGQGVLQAGMKALPSSGYQIEYIGQRPLVDQYLSRDGRLQAVAPLQVSIPALREDMCGRLVRIQSLMFDSPEQTTWGVPSASPAVPPSTGYRRFADPSGDAVMVVCSGYADFASELIPVGVRRNITGVLLYGPAPGTAGRSVYMLKIRDLGDVQP